MPRCHASLREISQEGYAPRFRREAENFPSPSKLGATGPERISWNWLGDGTFPCSAPAAG
jgi:hypothetical protein